jgi:hypothetical protein
LLATWILIRIDKHWWLPTWIRIRIPSPLRYNAGHWSRSILNRNRNRVREKFSFFNIKMLSGVFLKSCRGSWGGGASHQELRPFPSDEPRLHSLSSHCCLCCFCFCSYESWALALCLISLFHCPCFSCSFKFVIRDFGGLFSFVFSLPLLGFWLF